MTQEVLKQALEALEFHSAGDKIDEQIITSLRKAIQEEALRNVQRIGQEIEQEPVAQAFESTCSEALRAQGKPYPRTCKKCGLGPCIGKPQRTWVGLTDEEKITLAKHFRAADIDVFDVMEEIETELKQKNGYAEEKNT